jgi:phosphoribosyl-ATP pyrophosphohydrolase/phosphoribosyl-AMP cyclohydrolase
MKINFSKGDGLVPAIIQDADTKEVLMLGYMDEDAVKQTRKTGLVTFYSRSKQRLWTKGETSNNFLHFVDMKIDCDGDTLLITARPQGPVCHTGSDTCFGRIADDNGDFLYKLQTIIAQRAEQAPEESYTARLLDSGMNKIAQKVGEEATEVVIDAVSGNLPRLKEETADLLYHLLVLLKANNLSLADISSVLRQRHLTQK